MTTDGVLFDLDRTLWDSCCVVAESWGETLRRLDPAAICPGPEDVRGIMGMTAPQIAQALFSHYGEGAERAVRDSFPEYDGGGRMIFIPKASRKGDIVPPLTAALEKWTRAGGTVPQEADQ